MSIITYPLDGPTYFAEDVATYLCTRTSGVYAKETNFAVSITGSRELTVAPGLAWMNYDDFKGISVCSRESAVLEVPAADNTLGRIDRVVLQFDTDANLTALKLKPGVPSADPQPPAILQNHRQYELGLATIAVPAGSASISQANLTDTRTDEAVCGVMRDGVTGIPTAELVKQARARIAELEETASDSAAAADKSATAAAASQSAAAGSASTASTKASAAASSASAAQSAASGAAAQAATATRQATAAAGSASAAAKSAETAGSSAQNAKASEEAAAKSAAEAKAATGFDPNNYYNKTEADQKFGTPYTLPAATTTALGGVKLSEDFTTDEDGTLHLAGGTAPDPYPVGIVISMVGDTSPAALFGGTWEQVASERVLMGASSRHAAGTTVEAGLPNITGSTGEFASGYSHSPDRKNGALRYSGNGYNMGYYSSSGSGGYGYYIDFNASSSNAIYGRSSTVQPAAYYVHYWQRKA